MGLFVLSTVEQNAHKNGGIMSNESLDYKNSELYRIRHSTAHIMAEAVLEKFPTAKIAIGPPIDDGFYYDFDLPRALTPEDLEDLEKRMRELIKSKESFQREEVTAEEAKKLFSDQPYKLELIEGLEKGNVDDDGNEVTEKMPITIYKSGHFADLCRGPHVSDTSKINPNAIKLLNVAGAYWRGDEKRPMLQRIYGTAWEKPSQLEEYLWKLEEAKKRDHRKLGKELDLFSTNEEVGAGLVLWHPNGGMIRHLIERYWEGCPPEQWL
jgi:threonyl-tRNA synthetase